MICWLLRLWFLIAFLCLLMLLPNVSRGETYHAHVNNTVQASAHGATSGFWWLVNTSTSAKCQLWVFRVSIGPVAATAFASGPRLTIERMTFTGSPSGAQVMPAKRSSIAPMAVCTLRTANTGMTITADQIISAFNVPVVMTPVGAGSQPTVADLPLLDPILILNGEGIVFRQPDAGSASDTRRIVVNLVWYEH